jgi:hypothetical protein
MQLIMKTQISEQLFKILTYTEKTSIEFKELSELISNKDLINSLLNKQILTSIK